MNTKKIQEIAQERIEEVIYLIEQALEEKDNEDLREVFFIEKLIENGERFNEKDLEKIEKEYEKLRFKLSSLLCKMLK